ncbi:endonuclease [Bacillus sp. ISL-47]|uniref:endonuclease n=1 Tax=Bacillus sp. ISL-47 TaxID=2819130 RepID=UPI001BEB259A|nr:endonuclease [Bacillus sp. ISL-47]MBT2688062.1 endonuclease [Bacillus sp. ISL-47]MBT2707928.1 hypothetical protein [Pseudomonas sp. ISL-84]
MKRLFALFVIFPLLFAAAGCTSGEKESTETKTEETGLTDEEKSKFYNSVRVAELKVNEVFHKEVAADEKTPVINASFSDEESAVSFLSKYYSPDLAKDIYTHYATENNTEDGQMIVNEEPYFSPSVLDTEKEDAEIEGDKNKASVKTENITYQLELQESRYMVTSIEK